MNHTVNVRADDQHNELIIQGDFHKPLTTPKAMNALENGLNILGESVTDVRLTPLHVTGKTAFVVLVLNDVSVAQVGAAIAEWSKVATLTFIEIGCRELPEVSA